MFRRITKLRRRWEQFVFIAIILLFTIFLIINPPTDSGIDLRLVGAFCIPGFLIFLIYFSYYYQKYKRVNYSDSVKNVLKSAEKRFRFWHPSFYTVFVAIILVGIGAGIVVTHNFQSLTLVIVFCSAILIGFTSGFYMGHKQWKEESKPLWIATKKLLEELN